MFAIRLKELREQAGFSQAVLARKLGVRQSTVGMWENGKNKPQNSKLEMMASIFNVSTDYLLGRSDEPNTDNAEDELLFHQLPFAPSFLGFSSPFQTAFLLFDYVPFLDLYGLGETGV